MRSLGMRTLLMVPFFALGLMSPGYGAGRDDAAAESLGWRVALQCWTFNHLTAFEAIDRAKEMGIRYVEIYPGEKLRPGAETQIQHDMSKEDRDQLIAKLKEAGIKAVGYGVVGLSGKEQDDRPVFEFAKAVGIETISAEPPAEALDGIEKLANEYKINVALHNHPKPSRYWDPQVAYDAVKKHGPRIGLCADVGHWMRSGIDPVEALKKYGDRVISFHFKDLNEFGKPEAHDVPWGTGAGKTKEVLMVLKGLKFKGAFAIEYEHHPDDQLAQVGQCVTNFDKMAAACAEKK